MLFVPGDRGSALLKARVLLADALVFDLEDAVGPMQKSQARETIHQVLSNNKYKSKIVLRINSMENETWYNEDMSFIKEFSNKLNISAVLLPKVDSVQIINHTLEKLGSQNKLPVWTMIETAKGVKNVYSIAEHQRVDALVFGSNDLSKELNCKLTQHRDALLYSLSKCVVAAKAERKKVVDGVFMDIKDEKGLEEQCLQGKALGFDGKSLIHPNQVAIANKVFSPSDEEINHARRVVAAYESVQGNKGVTLLDNKLIEKLHYDQAVQTLSIAEEIARSLET
jgi:(3S)-malyl-CoA thioesterase